jgi:hypothetical protein
MYAIVDFFLNEDIFSKLFCIILLDVHNYLWKYDSLTIVSLTDNTTSQFLLPAMYLYNSVHRYR